MSTLSISDIFSNAIELAEKATKEYIAINGDNDFFGCGFSTVVLKKYNNKQLRKNSKVVKQLQELYGNQVCAKYGKIVFSNPSGISTQSKNALDAGSQAFKNYLKDNGFECYVHSRLN